MTHYQNAPRHDGNSASGMSDDQIPDSGPPLRGSAESTNDEYELQPFEFGNSVRCHTSEQPLPPGSRPDSLTSEGMWGSTTTRTERQISQEYQKTEIQDDEPRQHLLGQQDTAVPRSRSPLSIHLSETARKPTSDFASLIYSSTESRKHRTSHSSRRYWIWEISASILSLACIASVVGVLLYEQGKPLSQWGLGQTYLSPNVVVSFLGTLGKSACLVAVAGIVSQLKWLHFQKNPQELSDLQLFDDASRGPWGAAQLAVRKNMRALLATCASIITISSLLVDPFIQSAFQFPSILTPIQGVWPTILSAHKYDPISWSYHGYECHGTTVAEISMQKAVMAPILNATKSASHPCGFERCEWPTIATLGICSNCINMTEEVVSFCEYNANPEEWYQVITCNYTLPRSNVSLSATFGNSRRGEAPAQSTIWDSAADAWPQDFMESALDREISSIGFTKQIPAIVSNFSFVQLDPMDWTDYLSRAGPGRYSDVSVTPNPPVKRAMQCSMQLCARILEKPQYANSTASAFASRNIDLITMTNTSQTQERPLIYLEPHSDVDLPKNTTFHISFCEYSYLQTYLNTLFTAKISSDGMLQSTKGDSPDYISPTTFNMGWLLNQVEDIPTLMQQIADSMTEEIRTSADSDIIRGVAMQSEVFIAINWVWLALPISVTVLTFALLLCVIIINNARGMPAWRSSSLALLFHQVDGWDGAETVVGGPDDVKARAKEMKARVTYENGVLSFSKAL